MLLPLLGALATSAAVFSLLMAIFLPAIAVPKRLDAVRAAALPRERYEKLVSSERPWWERVVAPVAGRLARSMPSLASQVNEATIVRAGLDPASVSPAEVYAAKLVLGGGILLAGIALSAVVPILFLVALPAAFAGYVFPTEYLAYRTRKRQAELLRELPDFLALVRPLAAKSGLEHAVAEVSDALHEASGGQHLLAEQVRSAVAAYGIGSDLFAALRDIAVAADIEALDELAASLGSSRRLGKGVSEVLAEHERSLRDDERNRLVGSASMVQPKLAAILAGIYLPEFVLLVIVPLFIGAIGRI
jgi:Flp pilus assembly protein TadB